MGESHILPTRQGNYLLEERAGLQSQFVGGYNIVDPSAIPPPGMGVSQRAGVLVTEHSLLQVDVVFTALRIISNNIVNGRNLRRCGLISVDSHAPMRHNYLFV